jgi:hypothetical protein
MIKPPYFSGWIAECSTCGVLGQYRIPVPGYRPCEHKIRRKYCGMYVHNPRCVVTEVLSQEASALDAPKTPGNNASVPLENETPEVKPEASEVKSEPVSPATSEAGSLHTS